MAAALDLTAIIENVYKFFIKEKHSESKLKVDRPMCRLEEATGLTRSKLNYIMFTSKNKKPSTAKEKPRHYSTILDNFDRGVLRTEVKRQFKEGQVVRVRQLQHFIQTDLEKTVSWDTTRREVNLCGFRFMNPPTDGNNEKREKQEIVVWRNDYVRRITAARRENRKIVYLDESWVNANHRATKQWVEPETGLALSGKASEWHHMYHTYSINY